MRLKFIITLTCLIYLEYHLFAQDASKEIDNSKPTNLYSQVDNFLELTTTPDFDTYGYNPRISYAPSEAMSFVLETPFRYNTGTKKFGIGDIRLRTFWVPYKNYERTLGSFGASIDLFVPTGSFEDGLGSSSWRVSPGVIVGFILNQAQTISIFPNLSYLYTSKPTSEQVPAPLREVDHGLTIQVISSFVLSEDAFVLVTPILDVKDIEDAREDDFLLEIEPVIDIMADRFQTGLFYRGAFSSNIHTLSLNFTIFL